MATVARPAGRQPRSVCRHVVTLNGYLSHGKVCLKPGMTVAIALPDRGELHWARVTSTRPGIVAIHVACGDTGCYGTIEGAHPGTTVIGAGTDNDHGAGAAFTDILTVT